MHIDTLEVKNFRGFAERRFGFHPRFNVLIGDNGTGKTAVLQAARVGLSEMLRKLGFQKDAVTLSDEEDVRFGPQENASTGQVEYNPMYPSEVHTQVQFPPEWPVSEHAWTIRRTRRSVSGGRGRRNLGDIVDGLAAQRSEGEPVPMPVIAYYGTDRAILDANDPKGKPSWEDGYARCLATRVDHTFLETWFRDQRLLEADHGAPTPMYRAVKDAVASMIPGASDVRYDSRVSGIGVTFDTGERLPLRHLSDGFRTVLAVVADVATRIAYLNPSLGADAVTRAPGVVLIDELDLHLHPKWQRRIVNDLRATFQNVQFITTTHSPQVVSEVKDGIVLNLQATAPSGDVKAYGQDSNWILERVMGESARPSEIQTLMQKAEDALADKRYEQAKSFLRKARSALGSPSGEIVQLQAKIETLERLSTDANPSNSS